MIGNLFSINNVCENVCVCVCVCGGTCDMFIIIGNGFDELSSNPGQDFAYHFGLMPLGKTWIYLLLPAMNLSLLPAMGKTLRQTGSPYPGRGEKKKLYI